MNRFNSNALVTAFTLSGLAFSRGLSAQVTPKPSMPSQADLPAAESAVLPIPPTPPGGQPVAAVAIRAEKPALTVMAFEAGTVSAQVEGKGSFLTRRGGYGEKYEPSELGTGIADMLIEKLLATGQFRLLERKAIEGPSGAQFIVMGSVTRFGFEQSNVGGLAASVATMGLLSYKQHKTEVALTARIINAATGEIVASVSSKGVSGKGGGLRVFGMGSNGLGGADISSSNFRSTAIGQATERAVANLAEKIVQKKASF